MSYDGRVTIWPILLQLVQMQIEADKIPMVPDIAIEKS